MKRSSAIFCLDCEEIFDGERTVCPSCCSPATHPIGAWIRPLFKATRLEVKGEKQEEGLRN